MDTEKMALRLKLIACEILYREFCAAVALSANQVDVEFCPKGLHDIGQQVDEQAGSRTCSPNVDHVASTTQCCSATACAATGCRAGGQDVPLVLPKAHDCITLFLGARERYQEEHSRVATYWYVADQLERNDGYVAGAGGLAIGSDTDEQIEATRAAYVAKYGEDNAAYLMEVLGGWREHYGRAAFVAMGVADETASEATAREEADRRGWAFERIEGSMVLLKRLIDGDWNEDMLVLQPGERLAMSWDDDVVKSVPSAG